MVLKKDKIEPIKKLEGRPELKKKIINLLYRGKVIVCPTDTVYGLICDITSKKAVNQLFKIKKRSFLKPIPVFVKDIKMAKKIAVIGKKEERFLKKVWPGKVTCVLKAKKTPYYFWWKEKGVLGKNNTIGLRTPKYKILNQLLSAAKVPFSATSANISGKPALRKIKEIKEQFKKKKFQPDLILDGGDLKLSSPSTVVDLTKKKLKILRKGAVKKKDLPQFC